MTKSQPVQGSCVLPSTIQCNYISAYRGGVAGRRSCAGQLSLFRGEILLEKIE